MSRAYLTQKTKEALAACAGDRRDAALLLRAWSDGDIALREALVAPFMTNLCALAVQRVAARDAGPATPAERAAPASQASDLLRAIGDKHAETMTSTRGRGGPPPRGSVRHRQALNTLAGAFKPAGGSSHR